MKIVCVCGSVIETRSTTKDIRVEICSSCHPFFTGRQKIVDAEGRVERFTKKFGAQTVASRKKSKKVVEAPAPPAP